MDRSVMICEDTEVGDDLDENGEVSDDMTEDIEDSDIWQTMEWSVMI
jgi:hypothetical protein